MRSCDVLYLVEPCQTFLPSIFSIVEVKGKGNWLIPMSSYEGYRATSALLRYSCLSLSYVFLLSPGKKVLCCEVLVCAIVQVLDYLTGRTYLASAPYPYLTFFSYVDVLIW